MALDRLVLRYREAIEYFQSPVSESARFFERSEYAFCRSYVRDQYSDRSTRWNDDQHREAYEAARGGIGHV
jgi:hypothetical protein